ncbi:bifunctional MaoC family dehydratase N-terminal/OB-fold nucleic acid binding domain-containing protein [Nakamurella lactea]|jgi:uncharacterized OB-fold protein/acyl dehydratase|uniref:bifunctional MaoC family dehydratase N-terminal/OB-fold nucleic acid binding domain-containing protein n=1 Tax=Nakamurella lactea TaxID=459515 RepID=UPI000421E37F|nr:MaoC family dehydratase N-terminal domain-containing protein [Nakamurella lactea]
MSATTQQRPAAGPDAEEFLTQLRTFVGQQATPVRYAQDAVNPAMIRHFVEAMGDENPVYTDETAARSTGRSGIVAPPPMLSSWLMVGYKAHTAAAEHGAPDSPMTRLLNLLGDAGYVGVVATNDEQEYVRELRIGDRLKMTAVIEDVSPRKVTGLGAGHFITTLRTYTDADDQVVARQRFRILRFDPTVTKSSGQPAAADPGLRHRPFVMRDNQFWFDAARERRLVIQTCSDCGQLRHPPGPSCPQCGSFAWHETAAAGRGTVHSYVTSHHPKAPGYDYPLTVLLVDLEEGTRLVADYSGDPETVRVGLPVEVDWLDYGGDVTLPRFRNREEQS